MFDIKITDKVKTILGCIAIFCILVEVGFIFTYIFVGVKDDSQRCNQKGGTLIQGVCLDVKTIPLTQ